MELKPYPLPEGMAIPRLMPYQEYPWNGDHFIAEEVLRLKEAHGLKAALETGTCLGSTALWLNENFEEVSTCETSQQYVGIARSRFEGTSIVSYWQASEQICAGVMADFYFLDAHWNEHCPLLVELECIAKHSIKPCILIHDFQVPGKDFGFDSMPDGRPFNMEQVKPYLDRIYGEGKWKYNYPKEVAGARRGWVSIEPA